MVRGLAHGKELRMPSNHIPPFTDTETRHGVCVVDGHGAKIHIHHGHLVIEDGAGRQRRTRRFHKATADVTRIVMLARSGYVTIDAIQWLTDAGIALMHLDPSGRLLISSAPPSGHDSKLRRAQAGAADSQVGIDITRRILTTKIEGQADVAAGIDRNAGNRIDETLTGLEKATKLNELRLVEAEAASAYWAALSKQPVYFVASDTDRIPDHWNYFGTRRSSVSGNQRLAANPAHAILNYLYALLEAESRIACATAGLDPSIGILHTDQPYRDSLAFDVMEAARPDVDQYVIDLVAGHHFQKRDFYETRRGSCRINRRLTHALAETTHTWHRAVAPTIEAVAQTLVGKQPKWQRPTPTRLTQANRSSGRAGQRKGSAKPKRRSTPKPAGRCAECGTNISNRNRRCGPCNDRYQTERMEAANLAEQGRRRTGHDPSHGGEAARKRGATQAQRIRARQEWERSNEIPDPSVFGEEILPLLESVSIRAMAAATGLTAGYCSLVRRGKRIPHPMHWESFRSAGSDSSGDQTMLVIQKPEP